MFPCQIIHFLIQVSSSICLLNAEADTSNITHQWPRKLAKWCQIIPSNFPPTESDVEQDFISLRHQHDKNLNITYFCKQWAKNSMHLEAKQTIVTYFYFDSPNGIVAVWNSDFGVFESIIPEIVFLSKYERNIVWWNLIEPVH